MSPSQNDTPNTSQVSADELREKRVDELRQMAGDANISGRSSMRKEELVEALAGQQAGGGSPREERSDRADQGERGVTQSEDTKYSQVISSTGDEPEREGRSLVTTNHDVIRQWAEERDATPATVPGTEHGDHLGVLRFDFPGYGGDDLQHVSWDDWFGTFDERELNFLYQEQTSDGSTSNFFRLENPDRSDA